MSTTKLLVQPRDGTAPLIEAIDAAKEIIQIVIFRFDRADIEAALRRAIKRGVFVHALVAHTCVGQGGDTTLRKLEMRLLADGISVARSATDLLRYHDKSLLIDRKLLFLLTFNYTHIDIMRSRSFGIMTDREDWVAEAHKLFEADTLRQPYTHGCESFIVSPINARPTLLELIRSARKSILIYDDKLSDLGAMQLLAKKVRDGVDVRVIGTAGRRAAGVQVGPSHIRLHGQSIIIDEKEVFLGSQSLRTPELDSRREVGVIFTEPELVEEMVTLFETDWARIHSIRLVNNISDGSRGSEAIESPLIASTYDAQPAPAATIEEIKSAVKEAIKDALLESYQEEAGLEPLKKVINLAAKEALLELA